MHVPIGSALVFVAILVVLGLMAHLQVPGAQVAAVGAASSLAAWMMQPPRKRYDKNGNTIRPPADSGDSFPPGPKS